MMALKTGKTAVRLAAHEKFRFVLRNPHLLIAWPIAALLIASIGWSALFAKLNDDRHDIENFALAEAAALSRSYADHLSRTLEAIDQIILHVKFEWQVTNGHLRLERIKEEGLFPPSSVFNVGIVDQDGKLVTSTFHNAGSGGNNLNFENKQYFLAQKNAAEDFLYIGMPAIGSTSHRNMIQFSHRLADREGKFSGVVAVSVVPDYFTAAYDTMTLGGNGLLGVVGGDRVIRVTRTGQTVHPPDSQALISVPHFATQGGSALLNGNEWFRDKRSRYVGWQTVKGYPLIALTGLDEHDLLSAYRANHDDLIREARWATVALVAFVLIAMAQSIRLAWRKYQLEQTQATYRMATEGGNEGFYIVHPIRDRNGNSVDFEIIDCNQRGAEFVRQTRENLIGKKISLLYEGANFDRLLKMLCQAMETGFYENDVEVPSESPLTVQWIHCKIVRSNGDLAVTLRDISDAKAYVKELERHSNEDALTGLSNRYWVQTYLPQAIERAAENNAMLAVLFIDLDGFKSVNDAIGHPAGDELLRNAARRLKVAVRPHDHVVRLGGDEFVVIIDHLTRRMDAAHVAKRVLHAFKESFRLSQGVHTIGTSIGISIFPTDGADADTLLRNADIAMYSVKTSGKRNYRFYDQKFYDTLRARLEQESELRHAIEHDQLIMYYQPRVDILTGTTSSMEALVRWEHPTKGLLGPLDFIPLAEETGLILSLGELVIDKVCAQLADWEKTGQELVPVSINVSPRQFNEVDVAKILSASIAHHNIDAKLVEVELTESSVMGDSSDVSRTLMALRRMGIKLLVDDFGTGYSSLSQLQRLDFDVLKVDRAFTAEVDRTEKGHVFFKAIITMAHALGMRVVAEGVENENQIKILKSLHCDEIQGFYISKPLPPSETQPILPKWFFPSTV
jgi:diguanylate cyclase (GGDEF)-like protein